MKRRSFLQSLAAVPVAVAIAPHVAAASPAPLVLKGTAAGRMTSSNGGIVTLRNVKLAFPRLFEAGPRNTDFSPRYGATFTLRHGDADTAELIRTMCDVAESRWGKGVRFKTNLRDNGDFTTNSAMRPLVIDRDRTPLTAADDKLHPGCRVNASIQVFAAELGPHKRVGAQLRGVQFVSHG